MKSAATIACFLLGVAALVASFVWPSLDDGRSAWTDDQAARLADANQQLHRLAFSAPTPENEERLNQVREEQEALRAELEQAQQRSGRAAWWLRGLAALFFSIAVAVPRIASRAAAKG